MRLVLANSPRLKALLEAGRRRIREGQGIPHEDFWRDVESEKPAKAARKRKTV